MPKPFKLEIYSQDKALFDAEVYSLCVPAEDGYLGVLAHHAPLIAPLAKGKITFKDSSNNPGVILSEGGFLEVRNNKAVVLLNTWS